MELLQNSDHQQCSFHRSESRADANARAASKGKIGELRQVAREVLRPTLRLKRFGIREKARVAMSYPRAYHHTCPSWNAVAPDLAISQSNASHGVCRRV